MDYDALAPVYERVFGPEAAEGTWRTLERLLLPHLSPRARVLDLCCGTGEITARLLRAGLRVTGVDRSQAMLAYARQRAPRARFLKADMREFCPEPGSFAAVVCVYNSLPHLTSTRQLQAVFRMVARALAPGGRFVFDLYPEEAYSHGWRGVRPADGCVLAARYDAQTARAVTQIYWEGGSAELRIRCYGRADLRRLLRAAGLAEVRSYATGRATDGRQFWVCGTGRS